MIEHEGAEARYVPSVCKSPGCDLDALNESDHCYIHSGTKEEYTDDLLDKESLDVAVYFIMGVGTGLVKIGCSKDTKKRITGMQCDSPVKLELLGEFATSPDIEAVVHEYFKDDRVHGEWFTLTDRLIEFIDQVVSSGHDAVCEAAEKAGIKIKLW